jgi:signal transduction histidine kinase
MAKASNPPYKISLRILSFRINLKLLSYIIRRFSMAKQKDIKRVYGFPYFIGIFGGVLTLVIWHGLTNNYAAESTKIAFPWIILVIGIAVSILAGIALKLAELTDQRTIALKQVREDFFKEMAEHAKAEQSKQRLEIVMLQGQKLQAIGTLAGGIAHDFNNILYAIKGYTEIAREDLDPKTLVFTNLGKVLSAAERGQDLVGRILTFGRRRHHQEYKPLHIRMIIESALSLLKPTIPSSVSIDLYGITEDIVIMGDLTQLHQVIVNIITNAVDAMDGEGHIVIRVQHISANDLYLQQFPHITLVDYCRIEVGDSGHGMDETTRKRIFEPFFTTKPVGKGTGLGLATAHGIIKEHQGEITVTSQLGEGTIFTMLLPIAPFKGESQNGENPASGR